jgi:hypothetical protein
MPAESQLSNNACLLIKLEFSLGIAFAVGLNGEILGLKVKAEATDKRANVYVSIRKSDGACVKIGMTNQTTWGRWRPVINMIDGQKTLSSLRPNEVADQKLLRQFCFGQEIEIWHRKAFKLALEPDHGPRVSLKSLHLNEIYLDHLFKPLFGKDLSGRNQ